MRKLLVSALALLVLTVSLFPAAANAQTLAPSEEQLTMVMEDYFAGERSQAWAFLEIGTAGLGLGAYLFARGDDRARGASYPVLAVGLVQALVGAGVLLRTPSQVSEKRTRIAADPAGFTRSEIERMNGVMSRFAIVKYTEGALILAGLGLLAYGSLDDRPTLEGIGIGLAASTAVLLGMDLTAEGRGGAYQTRLRGFQPTVTTSGLYLGYTTVF